MNVGKEVNLQTSGGRTADDGANIYSGNGGKEMNLHHGHLNLKSVRSVRAYFEWMDVSSSTPTQKSRTSGSMKFLKHEGSCP